MVILVLPPSWMPILVAYEVVATQISTSRATIGSLQQQKSHTTSEMPPTRLGYLPQVPSFFSLSHTASRPRIRTSNSAIKLSSRHTSHRRPTTTPSRRTYSSAPHPPDNAQTTIHPIHPPSNPTLLRRLPSTARSLPVLDTVAVRWMWIRTIPPFLLIIGLSAAALFNYQKVRDNAPLSFSSSAILHFSKD